MKDIKRGESYSFSIGRSVNGSPIDLTTYGCSIRIVRSSDESVVLSRAITEQSVDNTRFLVNITPVETSQLIERTEYFIAYKLTDSASQYAKEQFISFRIIRSLMD